MADDLVGTMTRRSHRGPVVVVRSAIGAMLAVVVLLAAGVPGLRVPVAQAADPTLPPVATRWFEVAGDDVRVHLYFGWTSTCPHCAAARPFIDDLARELPWLTVHSLQIDGHDENVAFLVALADSIHEQLGAVPIFMFDERLLVGFDDAERIGAELRTALEAYHAQLTGSLGRTSSSTPGAADAANGGDAAVVVPFLGTVEAGSVSLPLVTAVLAGLDAFNPCALSVLLFLLSLLVASRSRARMALVGGVFVLVSGLAYFVFMAAWLNVFLLVGALRIITLLAGLAAVTAALINIKDYVWFRRGVSLVIPERAKPGIFGRMIEATDATRLPVMLGGTALVAIAANSYEALCTGGFPVVFTRILTLNDLPTSTYYLYLLLYNLIYVTPLLLMVVAFTVTLGSHTVTTREAQALKLLSGLLMLGLGLMLLLAPDRLSDPTATILVFGSAIAVWGVTLAVDRSRRRGRGTPPTPDARTPRAAAVRHR